MYWFDGVHHIADRPFIDFADIIVSSILYMYSTLYTYPLHVLQSLADPGSSTEPLVELMDLYSGTSEMLPINSVKSAVLDRVKIPTLHAL